MTPEEAELEADVFLSVIKGKQFEMPVYFDLEEKKQFDLGKKQVSAIMRAFLKRVESAGYFVGLYGSASSLTTHTADDIKSWYTDLAGALGRSDQLQRRIRYLAVQRERKGRRYQRQCGSGYLL